MSSMTLMIREISVEEVSISPMASTMRCIDSEPLVATLSALCAVSVTMAVISWRAALIDWRLVRCS